MTSKTLRENDDQTGRPREHDAGAVDDTAEALGRVGAPEGIAVSGQLALMVRVFDRKEHADALLDGRISMGRLSAHRVADDTRRRDPHEGGVRWPGVMVTLRPHGAEGLAKEFKADLLYNDGYEDIVYAYCCTLFVVNMDASSSKRLHEQISESVLVLEEFGSYTVVIGDVSTFIHRVNKALPAPPKILARDHGLVEYRVDTPVEYGNLHRRDAAAALARRFRKDPSYAMEREWRWVAVSGDGRKEDRLEFDVGDLRDIAFRVTTRELGRMRIDVKLE